MDVGTGLALLGTAKIIEKILGPTAAYIGDGLKDWTKNRVLNVQKIFKAAEKKLGNRIEKDGRVPPRVLAKILQEGSFCDDELASDYFGGVLASSRSDVDRDDRGATFAALLSRLSSYQIRSHYLFYSIFKSVFDGSGFALSPIERPQMEVFIPHPVYAQGMDFIEEEKSRVHTILDHVLHGLSQEELIRSHFWHADKDHIGAKFTDAVEGGIGTSPSVLGAHLFLWAHGRSDLDIREFLRQENEFPTVKGIEILPGSIATGLEPRKWNL